MVASDFAFLALGLILGIPAGAALLIAFRARPPVQREVRLTVTPDSVPRRRSATLATDPFTVDGGSARGGPADTAWNTDPATPVVPERAGWSPVMATGDAVTILSAMAAPSAPENLQPVIIGTPVRSSVGVDIGSGVDPMIAAIRGTAARQRVPVGVAGGTLEMTSAEHARTVVATPVRAIGEGDAGHPEADAGDTPSASAAGAGPGASGDTAAAAPCADERHAVDERCALADRMRALADQAAAKLRDTQREYDTHVSLAEEAGAIVDPRAQRAAKDAAQRSFRTGREAAVSREAVEAAARTWLQEINRINAEAREAGATLANQRAAAAPLLATVERLTIQADAARVQAESAGESCVMARETLATCEEAQQRSPASMPLEPSLAPGEAPDRSGSNIPAWAEPVTPILGTRSALDEADEGGLLEAAALGGQPAIYRLLAGDHAAMERIVIAVAGDDAEERRKWQLLLADFVDAVLARAIEACAFEFPADHPFWAPFSRSQARDIALALSSLGYRFDGLRGFADERVPSQRDLSLALSYAGLDPMRVRRWPNDEEMGTLFAEVSVAADEYLSGAAVGLTLGELVSVLGRRADTLTDLWNAWGRVRPLLLEPSEQSNRP